MIDNITNNIPKKEKQQWELDIEKVVQITKLWKAFKESVESHSV